MRRWPLIVPLLLVAAACGDGNEVGAGPSSPTTVPPVTTSTIAAANPAAAQSCDELANVFLSSNQLFLDDLGETPAEDFNALMRPLFEEQESLPAPIADLKARSDAMRIHMDKLACSDEELQRLAFKRADRLQAQGTAGELWISILLEESDSELEDDPAEPDERQPRAGSD